MIRAMPAAVILVLLLAGLLALVPVWRLRVAGWPPAWLFGSWVAYAVMILVTMRFAAVTKFVLPLLVIAYVAPFVAGPERLARVLGGRRTAAPRRVIDVTPPAPPALAAAPRRRPGARTLRADPPGGEVFDAPPGPVVDGDADGGDAS